MAFFDTLASKSKDVAEKAKKLAEVTSLNSQISSKETEIKNLYREIGTVIYENKATWKEVDLSGLFGKVEALEADIEKLREEILVVRGVKICAQCGAEIDGDVAFCPKCGTPAPQASAAEEVVAEVAAEEIPVSEETPAE